MSKQSYPTRDGETHTYVECTPREYEKYSKIYQGSLWGIPQLNHMPNSLGGRNHIQFTVSVIGGVTTYWINRNKHPKYKGVF